MQNLEMLLFGSRNPRNPQAECGVMGIVLSKVAFPKLHLGINAVLGKLRNVSWAESLLLNTGSHN